MAVNCCWLSSATTLDLKMGNCHPETKFPREIDTTNATMTWLSGRSLPLVEMPALAGEIVLPVWQTACFPIKDRHLDQRSAGRDLWDIKNQKGFIHHSGQDVIGNVSEGWQHYKIDYGVATKKWTNKNEPIYSTLYLVLNT